MKRLRVALRKEFLQFRRDWLLIALIVFIYTGDVVMCTIALTFDVSNVSLAVNDQDASPLSRQLIARFDATDSFGRIVMLATPSEVDRLLDRGEADVALLIPPGFERAVLSGRQGEVQFVISGANSNVANAARGYAEAIVERFSHDVVQLQARARGLTTATPTVDPQVRVWYNPNLKFRHFMAVSMIVVAALMVGVVTTAASLVREKETGTAEQLRVTPLRPYEVVLAKTVPPFVVGMAALVPGLAIAKAFGAPLTGSIPLFVLASALALAASMAIGILIATFAATLQQALLIAFFVLFPLMFLSGTTVPLESVPAAMQYLSLVSPIRYYMEIAVSLLIKGVGAADVWPQFAYLTLTASVLLVAGLTRLRKHLYA